MLCFILIKYFTPYCYNTFLFHQMLHEFSNWRNKNEKFTFCFCEVDCGMKWSYRSCLLHKEKKLLLFFNCGVVSYRFPAQLTTIHSSINFTSIKLILFNKTKEKIKVGLSSLGQVCWKQSRWNGVLCWRTEWRPAALDGPLAHNPRKLKRRANPFNISSLSSAAAAIN